MRNNRLRCLDLRTSVHDVVLVEIVDGIQDLADGLRGVLFSKASLFADAVEQLASGGQLGNNVVFVLGARGERWSRKTKHDVSYLGLKPVVEANNVRVLQALQHFELIVDHLLIAPDVFLQDDLDGNAAVRAVGLADNSICTGTQSLAESIPGPVVAFSIRGGGDGARVADFLS